MAEKACIFCDIAARKLSAHIIWEDESFIAFLSIFPNTLGTSVVIPKRHYSSYVFDLPEDVLEEFMQRVRHVAHMLDSTFEDVGRCGLVFEGFGVNHVHAKLFPLHGTNFDDWRPIKPRVDKYFESYEGYISSHDYKQADDQELRSLAENIRKHA